MNRRELLRNTLLGAVGATAAVEAREFPANYDASKELANPNWKPAFLSEHQNENAAPAERHDHSGNRYGGSKNGAGESLHRSAAGRRDARHAAIVPQQPGVHRRRRRAAVMAARSCIFRKRRSSSCCTFSRIRIRCRRGAKARPASRSGYTHFQNLKGWISRIFYSSEAGMKALGWNGEAPHGDWTGCDPEAKKARLIMRHRSFPNLRRDRGGLRRHRRMGCQAPLRSRFDTWRCSKRAAIFRPTNSPSTCSLTKLQFRDYVAGDREDAADPEAMLRLLEYNYDWFVNDLENPYSTPQGQAVHLAAAAHRGRTDAGVGPPELSHERSRFQGLQPRWLRPGLADLLRRSLAVLRHRRRITSASAAR